MSVDRIHDILFRAFLLLVLLVCAPACSSDDDPDPSTQVDATSETTDPALECAQSNVLAQCPAGTNPELSATSTTTCQASTDGIVTEEGVDVGWCVTESQCTVLCRFMNPCSCGVESVDANGIYCAECIGACGDLTCDAGETADTCPMDCGP